MRSKAVARREFDDYRIRIRTKLSLLSYHDVNGANDLFPSPMWVATAAQSALLGWARLHL